MQHFNNFLASVHYLNHPLLSGLSALGILSMGIFVLCKNVKSELYRAFFGMAFILSIWFFGNTLSMFYFDNFERAIFWFMFGYTGVIFMSAAYYNFYLAYSQKKNKIIYPLYIICVLEVFYLWFYGDIKSGAYVLPNVGIVWQEMSAFSYFLIFGMVKYIIVSAITFISFLNEYKKETGLQKKRVKWLAAVFFLTVLGSIEWLVIFNIPLHIAWVLLPVLIGIIAYAILKYQLMDIKVIIKKAFFYSIGIALASGIIVGISFLSNWFVENIPGFRFWTVPLIAGIAAFIIGNLFWRKSKQVEKAYIIEKQAHQELQHLSEVKDQFILATQHHLRTPLTIMKGYLSVVLAKNKETLIGEVGGHLNKTLNSTNRLIKLVNELLDISQLEIGKNPLDIRPINIRNIIQGIIKELQPDIKVKNLVIKIFPEDKEEWPILLADQEKLTVVFSNLINNAVKYTPHHPPAGGGAGQAPSTSSGQASQIVIQSKKIDSFYQISIKDNGIGINPEELPTLFTRYFERGEQAQKLYTTGRGIGLFIAASIVKAHNGKIWAESEGLNKGATFYVELPIRQD